MKNILFLAYYFPPQTSVGVLRAKRLVETADPKEMRVSVLSVKEPDQQFHKAGSDYLKEYAGHPVEYVREVPVKPLWQLPAAVFARLAKLAGKSVDIRRICRALWYIDMEYGWIVPSILKALQMNRRTPFDGIVVSAPPFSSLLTGLILKKLLHIPLVADYRDAWTYDTFSYHSGRDRRRELKVLSSFDHAIVTSWSDYANYSGVLGEDKVSLITNGIEKKIDITPIPNDVFTIVYTGAWGTFGSGPDNLLRALKECSFKWKLVTVPENEMVTRSANELGVIENIESHPRCSPYELVRYFERADLLFITKAAPVYGDGIDTHISAKLYDYCASGRAVLGELPDGDSLRFMKKYAGRSYHAYPGDHRALVEQLTRAHDDWKREGVVYSDTDSFCAEFLGSRLSKAIADRILEVVSA